MKREYHKPYLAVEFFQLSASIAASCSSQGKVAINHGEDSCWMGDDPGEETIEYLGNACAFNLIHFDEGGDENDSFCYHGPIDPYATFMNS